MPLEKNVVPSKRACLHALVAGRTYCTNQFMKLLASTERFESRTGTILENITDAQKQLNVYFPGS